ncbi:MAG TPA: hypothetical protein VF169_15030 [Albitalea sp.]|uniref:hypothetical protein n=1 Tax=Piscinibacter sp. TaxID=1903157 RepID=UPI002ED01BA3
MPTKSNKKGKLQDLIFYAVDKASPYALALHKETDSLEKIKAFTLTKLAITDQGVAYMWMWINAHSTALGAKPVGPDTASDCKTVADVVKAVFDTTAPEKTKEQPPAAKKKAATTKKVPA